MKTFVALWAFVTAGLLLIAAGLAWMFWNLRGLLPPSLSWVPWSWLRWSALVGLFPLLSVVDTARAWLSAPDRSELRPGGSVYAKLLIGGFISAGIAASLSGIGALMSGLMYLSKQSLSNADGPQCDSSTMHFGDRCVDIPGGRVHSYGEMAHEYSSAAWQAHLAGNFFWVSVAVAVVSLTLVVISFFKLERWLPE